MRDDGVPGACRAGGPRSAASPCSSSAARFPGAPNTSPFAPSASPPAARDSPGTISSVHASSGALSWEGARSHASPQPCALAVAAASTATRPSSALLLLSSRRAERRGQKTARLAIAIGACCFPLPRARQRACHTKLNVSASLNRTLSFSGLHHKPPHGNADKVLVLETKPLKPERHG